MNDLKWMSKAEFFEALDSPTNENDSVVFKQMNLFGPYYIQDLSFKQCLEYPKDINHVTYKDRLPMYRMCDLAYPMDNPLGKETKPLRKLCIEKCKELQRCKNHTAQQLPMRCVCLSRISLTIDSLLLKKESCRHIILLSLIRVQ